MTLLILKYLKNMIFMRHNHSMKINMLKFHILYEDFVECHLKNWESLNHFLML